MLLLRQAPAFTLTFDIDGHRIAQAQCTRVHQACVWEADSTRCEISL